MKMCPLLNITGYIDIFILSYGNWRMTLQCSIILDYIDENLEQIETDMNTCIRTAYKKSGFHHRNKSGANKPRR